MPTSCNRKIRPLDENKNLLMQMNTSPIWRATSRLIFSKMPLL
jgi:hypothetical protein